MKLPTPHDFQFVLITTMKDECPYILDWLAYHFSIGFTHVVILTNDCSDGTDRLCRNLEALGIVTHMNNKGPHPRGVQKTAWKRAQRLKPVQEAEWIMALDVDEYLYLELRNGTLGEMFELFKEEPIAISFVWQIFGNNGVKALVDEPVTAQFTRASHPLQGRPYTIRGIKTLYRNRLFESIGTHRPHDAKVGAIADRHWINGDAVPVDVLIREPYWCVWDNGFLFGGALGRIHHYALRSKEAFMLKMLRGFVNRTEKGVRAKNSPLEYWNMFDWNVVEDTKILDRKAPQDEIKSALTSNGKILRLHNSGVAYHQEMAQKAINDNPEFAEEFSQILEVEPKTKLSVNDPQLQSDSPFPIKFSTKGFMSQSAKGLIRQPLIDLYYTKLTNID